MYGSVVPVSARDPSKFQHQVSQYINDLSCVFFYAHISTTLTCYSHNNMLCYTKRLCYHTYYHHASSWFLHVHNAEGRLVTECVTIRNYSFELVCWKRQSLWQCDVRIIV